MEPTPGPSRLELLRAELKHRVEGARELSQYLPRLRDNFRGMRSVLTSGMQPTPRTIFTERDVSPYRRFDWNLVRPEGRKGRQERAWWNDQ